MKVIGLKKLVELRERFRFLIGSFSFSLSFFLSIFLTHAFSRAVAHSIYVLYLPAALYVVVSSYVIRSMGEVSLRSFRDIQEGGSSGGSQAIVLTLMLLEISMLFSAGLGIGLLVSTFIQ